MKKKTSPKTGTRQRALVVGVSNYPAPIPELPAVAADVREMAKLLTSKNGTFTSVGVTVLTNRQASRPAIIKNLGTTFSGAAADETVFVYLAGHGSAEENEYFFVAHDTDCGDLCATGISLGEIKSLFDRTQSRRVFLWLDFCHSGGILARSPESDDHSIIRRTLQVVRGEGKVIVAACTSTQSAQGEVTAMSLYDFIDHQVASGRQQPMFFGEMTGRVVLMHYPDRTGTPSTPKKKAKSANSKGKARPKKSGTWEVVQKGSAAHSADMRKASLAVEFAALDREETLGDQIEWPAEFCEMPDSNGIPVLDDTPVPIRLPGGQTFPIPSVSSLDLHGRLNTHFYHEFANYESFRRLVRKIRLVITNKGEVPATDVRLEMLVFSGEGVAVFDESETPVRPGRRKSFLDATGMNNLRMRPAFQHAGYVDIDRSEHQTKVEIDCGNLQPGRRVWTDAFCIGIGRSGEVKLTGYLYAANLFHPQEFTLTINATIQRTSMTVDELLALSEKGRDNDDSEDDDIDC